MLMRLSVRSVTSTGSQTSIAAIMHDRLLAQAAQRAISTKLTLNSQSSEQIILVACRPLCVQGMSGGHRHALRFPTNLGAAEDQVLLFCLYVVARAAAAVSHCYRLLPIVAIHCCAIRSPFNYSLQSVRFPAQIAF